MESIHQFLKKVSSKCSTKTIILIDEAEMFLWGAQQYLRLLENVYNNVDLFMSLSPWVLRGQRHIEAFQVVAPKSKNIYSSQLLCRHRNSAKIYDFLCHKLKWQTEEPPGKQHFNYINQLKRGLKYCVIVACNSVLQYNLSSDIDSAILFQNNCKVLIMPFKFCNTFPLLP